MVDSLNSEQLKQLYTIFQILDGDGDGRVDAADLQGFLATFNNNFSLQEVEAFINDESCQPNGVLDFPEFVNTVSRLIAASLDTPPEVDDEAISAALEEWDKDGDGLISANDLRTACRESGEEWTDQQVNDMIYFKKPDGFFSFEDLREMIMGPRSKDGATAK